VVRHLHCDRRRRCRSHLEQGEDAETEAAEILKKFLRDGPKPSKECARHLASEGYELQLVRSGHVINPGINASRVRKKAGVLSGKLQGDEHYSWYLDVKAKVQ
jgi:hypothetical protein